MITEELKRSQDSYIQLALNIARQMPKSGSPSIRKQYYALSGIRYGLRAAVKGLQALQELYSKTDMSGQFLNLSEKLEDYYSIARTASIETLEEMGRIIEIEMRKLEDEEPDGNHKAPAPQP